MSVVNYDDLEYEKCPHCSKLIPANIYNCPKCGEYTTGGTTPVRRRRLWVVVTAIAVLLVFLGWVLGIV